MSRCFLCVYISPAEIILALIIVPDSLVTSVKIALFCDSNMLQSLFVVLGDKMCCSSNMGLSMKTTITTLL